MTEFLGIKNVVDAKPIIGKDGIADGFEVYYLKQGTAHGKTITKQCKQNVYVREFDYKAEKHKKAPTTRKRIAKKPNLEVVARILGTKVGKR